MNTGVRQFDQREYDRLKPLSDAGQAVATNNIAILFRDVNRHDSALAYVSKAHEQDPWSIGVLTTYLRTLLQMGRHNAFIGLYERSLGRLAMEDRHHQWAFQAYLAVNRVDQAMAAWSRVAAAEASEPGRTWLAMRLMRSLSKYREALVCHLALEAMGEVRNHQRIPLLFQLGDHEQVLDLYQGLPTPLPDNLAVKSVVFAAVYADRRDILADLEPRLSGGVGALVRNVLADVATVTIRGRRSYELAFMPRNLSISIPHCSGRFYEADTLASHAGFLKAGDVVLDVGANVGNHTLYFAGEAGCRVLPFECNPALSDVLRANIDRNGLADRIDGSWIGHAVAETSGTANFTFNREDFSTASAVATPTSTPVPAVALDDVGVEGCRLLKIDVDGAEVGVLKGAARLLRTQRPIVAVEVLNRNFTEVHRVMQDAGYRIDREKRGTEEYSDFVFVVA